MVEVYPTNIWVRAKWQQERDAARVPRGACPRVSVADELDQFHIEMAKRVSIEAARRLEERLKTYVGMVQARFPAWAKRVTVQLADRAHAIQDDFVKINDAREFYNKAIVMVQKAYEPAERDIEEWLAANTGAALTSRSVDVLVAGLREVSVHGQRLTYVTDRVDKGISWDARKYWGAMDRVRRPDQFWLEGVNDLRMRLRPV